MSRREPHRRLRLLRLLRCPFCKSRSRPASPKPDSKRSSSLPRQETKLPSSPPKSETKRHSDSSKSETKHRSDTPDSEAKHPEASPRLTRSKSHPEPTLSRSKSYTEKCELAKGFDLRKTLPWVGHSLLLLPSEDPTPLKIPTCLCATADFIARHKTTPNLFRDSGDAATVELLMKHYCHGEDIGIYMRDMVPFPCLPGHISFEVHDVAATFKRLVAMLPGGILGSLSLFDLIHAKLHRQDGTREKSLGKAQALGIGSVINKLESPVRKHTINAIFGLLNLIGRAAEQSPKEGNGDPATPSPDLMDYRALSFVFSPLLVSESLDPCCKWSSKDDSLIHTDHVTRMLITHWPQVAKAIDNCCSHGWRLDRKPSSQAAARKTISHFRKPQYSQKRHSNLGTVRSTYAKRRRSKEQMRSKSVASKSKSNGQPPQGRDRHNLHLELLSKTPKLKAITSQKGPGDKRRQRIVGSETNSPTTQSQVTTPILGNTARGSSYFPLQWSAPERLHQGVGQENAQAREPQPLGHFILLNADAADRSKLRRSRSSKPSVPRYDRSPVVKHLSSPLSPVLSTVLSMDFEQKETDEPSLRRSRSMGSLIPERSLPRLDLRSVPSMNIDYEKPDEARLRSPQGLGTMIPHPEQPPVAHHLNLSRPPSATRPLSATHSHETVYPGLLTPLSTTPIPRPGSTTYLHTQIRHVQHQLQSRTEEVWQLKRQLEAHEHAEVGTLSEQLREARRDVRTLRDRAEGAERRIKVFEKFISRLNGMKWANASLSAKDSREENQGREEVKESSLQSPT